MLGVGGANVEIEHEDDTWRMDLTSNIHTHSRGLIQEQKSFFMTSFYQSSGRFVYFHERPGYVKGIYSNFRRTEAKVA